MMGASNISEGARLDVEARFLQATIRTARLALLQELRRIRRLLLLIELFPPAGWFGARARLELAEDSHAKASNNLKRALDQIDAIGAANTQALASGGAEVAPEVVPRPWEASKPALPTTPDVGGGD